MNTREDPLSTLRSDAHTIFTGALAECAVELAFKRHVQFDGWQMLRYRSPKLPPQVESLEGKSKALVIAFGKAALPMLHALLAGLPEKLKVAGVCSAPCIPTRQHRHIQYFAGAHPLPNEDSFAAAAAALQLLRRARADTVIFFLISGGGSAMLEQPRDRAIGLEDVRAFYETLVHSGAPIAQVNTVRKYFSAVKGGRLAQAAPAEARKLTFLIADVPMKEIGVVASSPTLPDHSTWAECQQVLEQWHLLPRFPAAVREYFQNAALPAPPEGPAALPHSDVEVLLSNHDLVSAARDQARSLGYRVVIDNSCDDWPYERAAQYLLDRLRAARTEGERLCLLSSGEVTVAMGDMRPGCGGRNQQFVLEVALSLASEVHPTAVLSAGSDGVDGNSPAAGAIADPTTVTRSRQFHFDPAEALARFNSCPLFTALGDVVMTGPTGNNLRDLRVLLTSS